MLLGRKWILCLASFFSLNSLDSRARFTNAAIYEGLEQGKSLEESKKYAGNLKYPFMDTSYSIREYREAHIKAGLMDANSTLLEQEENIIDFNASNNNIMDLRKYGIEGDWRSYNIYENKNAMISEIEKKMSQFNFMLNNEDLMKEEYMKLDADYHDLGNNAGYKKIINDILMPRMKQGLDIFENYKIYDSIDAKA